MFVICGHKQIFKHSKQIFLKLASFNSEIVEPLQATCEVSNRPQLLPSLVHISSSCTVFHFELSISCFVFTIPGFDLCTATWLQTGSPL